MFLTGVVESFLVARGTSRLAIRKGMTLAAALGTGVASLGYAAARTPLQAAGAVVCFCLARECTRSACTVWLGLTRCWAQTNVTRAASTPISKRSAAPTPPPSLPSPIRSARSAAPRYRPSPSSCTGGRGRGRRCSLRRPGCWLSAGWCTARSSRCAPAGKSWCATNNSPLLPFNCLVCRPRLAYVYVCDDGRAV